jgi:drug/metabolite transporter (DMT)-like permease
MARHPLGLGPSLSLVLACACWAFGTVIAKDWLAAVPPITFFVVQLVPSAVALWLLVLARGIGRVRWRGLLPLALIGWINPGLSYTLSMLGLARTTASVTTLLWAAEPALILIMAWLLLREAITARLLLLTAVAGGGVLLVTGLGSGGDPIAGSPVGAALILGGVLCCALYTVLSRRIAASIDPLFTVALQQTVGLVWALAIWPIELALLPAGQPLGLSTASLAGGAISGLLYYAAAFWFYLGALKSAPATTAGLFLNLTPLFGVAAAHLFLGERLASSQWIGAVAILAAVVALFAWSAPTKSPEPAG